jgi:PAS domain S-box-containing protein
MLTLIDSLLDTLTPVQLEQRQTARAFNILVIGSILLNLLDVVGGFLVGEGLRYSIVLIVIELGLLALVRLGRVKDAATVLCIVLISTSGLVALLGTASSTTALVTDVGVVIIAAAFLPLRRTLMIVVITVVVVVAIFLYHALNSSTLPVMSTSVLLFNNFSVVLGLSIIIGVVAWYIVQLRGYIDRNQQNMAQHVRALREEIQGRSTNQRAQERLSTILESTSDFVAMLDIQEQKPVYMNYSGRAMLGLDEDAPMPTTLADIHPATELEEILNEGVPTALTEGIWEGETAILDADGKEIPVSQVIIAHRDATGKTEYLSTIIRDLTESRRLEQERLGRAVHEERTRVLRDFIGSMAHDIKTPLATLNTNLYLMDTKQEPAEEHKKRISTMRRLVQQLQGLTRDMVAYAQLESAPPLKRQRVDVNKLLRKTEQDLQPNAEFKRISTSLELDSKLPEIWGDFDDLNRVTGNLLENALNYTPDGGRVVLRSYPQGSGIIIEVADTGVGIQETDIPHIFDQFYRAAAARALQSGGTGLGLTIVKKIVARHQGTVEVQSQPDRGTTFRVWLPLKGNQKQTSA